MVAMPAMIPVQEEVQADAGQQEKKKWQRAEHMGSVLKPEKQAGD